MTSSVKAEHQELVDELSGQYSHIESNVSAFAAMVHIGGFVPLEARKAPWKHRMAPLRPSVVSSPEEREQAFILELEATDPLVLIASGSSSSAGALRRGYESTQLGA